MLLIMMGSVLLIGAIGGNGSYQLDPNYSRQVSDAVEQVTGRQVASIECPPASSLHVDQEISCRGTFGDGEELVADLRTEGTGQVNLHTINGEYVREIELHRSLSERGIEIHDEDYERVSSMAAPALVAIGAILLIIGVAALVGFIRLQRSQYVTSLLPAIPNQDVFFDRPGSYTLYMRGSRKLLWELRSVDAGLWDPVGQTYVQSYDTSILSFQSSGIRKVQRSWKAFTVPRAGSYILVLDGLDPTRRYDDRLIFGKASIFKLMGLLGAAILCIILGVFPLMAGISMIAQ